ncbi:MAG: cytochrome b [Lysobacterales bacterium]
MTKSKASEIRVWDLPVRLGHCLLAIGVFAAWFTRHGFGTTHDYLGYLVLAVVFFRLIWGFIGNPYARFRQFVVSPSHIIAYFKALQKGNAKEHTGHNPLGGWMILALLAMVLLVCASGVMYTTDRFWGVEWVETTHRILSNILLGLVGLHVAGGIWTSMRKKQNLVLSMIHGRKRDQSGSN